MTILITKNNGKLYYEDTTQGVLVEMTDEIRKLFPTIDVEEGKWLSIYYHAKRVLDEDDSIDDYASLHPIIVKMYQGIRAKFGYDLRRKWSRKPYPLIRFLVFFHLVSKGYTKKAIQDMMNRDYCNYYHIRLDDVLADKKYKFQEIWNYLKNEDYDRKGY